LLSSPPRCEDALEGYHHLSHFVFSTSGMRGIATKGFYVSIPCMLISLALTVLCKYDGELSHPAIYVIAALLGALTVAVARR